MWSSKCLLQASWGATTEQVKEWQETLTRNPFHTLYRSDPSLKQNDHKFCHTMTFQLGIWPYCQRANQVNPKASLLARAQLCTCPKSGCEYHLGVNQHTLLRVTAPLYSLRPSVTLTQLSYSNTLTQQRHSKQMGTLNDRALSIIKPAIPDGWD